VRFSSIPGLPEVKSLLLRSAQSGHVAHAQLFAGVEGGAALALALAYVSYLNCQAPTDTDSCGQCPGCSKNDKLVHPDLHFVLPVTATAKIPAPALTSKFLEDWRAFIQEDPFRALEDWLEWIGAENKQAAISREEAGQLLHKVSLAVFEGPWKAVVLWLPELLHPAAANALLKLLEEPPRQTVFLLVTQNAGALLPTIVSRTQRISVRAHTEEELAEYLETAHAVPTAAAQATAQLADGSLRAALALRSEVGTELFDFLIDWLRLCWGAKWQELLDKRSEEFQKLGREGQKHMLRYALGLVRKVLLVGLDPALVPALSATEGDTVRKMSRLITPQNADAIVRALTDAHYHVERNANPKLVFFDTSLTLFPLLRG
jgi:DNA polymerase III subunit delta'